MTMTDSLDSLVKSTIRKTRISLIFTTLFVTSILASTFFLSKEAFELSTTVQAQKIELVETKKELAERQIDLDKVRAEILLQKMSINHLQTAIRHLLNRNYQDAISGFKNFLRISPNDAEGLNYLGYTEYRYANQLMGSAADSASIKEVNDMYAAAERHLKLSIEKDPENIWPRYNLTLLLYTTDKSDEAALSLQELLNNHPDAIKFICDDGQFRKFAKEKNDQKSLRAVLSSTLDAKGINKCWVLS